MKEPTQIACKGNKGPLSIFQDQLKIVPWRQKVNGAYWLSSTGAGTLLIGYLLCDKCF
jgi:hypothetical protein